MKKEQPTFWLSNFSNMNVSLADLNLTVKAYSTVNLLDKKHYKYTLEQLTKSVESGSIFKKRDKLIVRKIAPVELNADILVISSAFIPSRARSVLVVEDKVYEEVNIIEEQRLEDEKFAAENIDLIDVDDKVVKKD